jgi:hypothetical protein
MGTASPAPAGTETDAAPRRRRPLDLSVVRSARRPPSGRLRWTRAISASPARARKPLWAVSSTVGSNPTPSAPQAVIPLSGRDHGLFEGRRVVRPGGSTRANETPRVAIDAIATRGLLREEAPPGQRV